MSSRISSIRDSWLPRSRRDEVDCAIIHAHSELMVLSLATNSTGEAHELAEVRTIPVFGVPVSAAGTLSLFSPWDSFDMNVCVRAPRFLPCRCWRPQACSFHVVPKRVKFLIDVLALTLCDGCPSHSLFRWVKFRTAFVLPFGGTVDGCNFHRPTHGITDDVRKSGERRQLASTNLPLQLSEVMAIIVLALRSNVCG